MAKESIASLPPTLFIAKNHPSVAPIIEREFKRICPQLTLLNFNRCSDRLHWIKFSGTETELLSSGVIDSSLIAVRPKRIASRSGNSYAFSRRLARDRVEVTLHLDESLDRSHPLAPLATWNWETILEMSEPPVGPHTAPEWKEMVLDNIDSDLGFLESWSGKLWRGKCRCVNSRFRFSPDDIGHFESIIHRFRKELITTMEKAAVIDVARSHLRLIIDNKPVEVTHV